MFRILAEKTANIGKVEANKVVDQWLDTYTSWVDDPTPDEITLADDPITDAPQHFRGDLRFERDNDMTTIRDQIETALAGVTSWYRIAYHQCSHDESEATACSWDSVTDYGSVPNGMPTFE
jgi:hypothetical protein